MLFRINDRSRFKFLKFRVKCYFELLLRNMSENVRQKGRTIVSFIYQSCADREGVHTICANAP